MFSKTLAHDPETGFPTKKHVDRVLAAEKEPTSSNLDAIVLSDSEHRVRKLEGLTNSRSGSDMGDPPEEVVVCPYFYQIESGESAFEMAEVYGMALLRDVPFAEYSTNPTVQMVLRNLNKFPSKTSAPTVSGSITAQTLFRGSGPGEDVGPYISQFLYKSYNYGAMPIEQMYNENLDPTNMLDMNGWLAVQNGEDPGSVVTKRRAYTASGRVLGSIVHSDPAFQCYYAAALIALQQGVETEGYTTNQISTAWMTTGPPDLFTSVAHVAAGALRTAWLQKWGITMRIRPEVFAQRYELARKRADLLDKRTGVPGLAELKAHVETASELLEAVLADNKARVGEETALLAVQYPEGSPTHPSLPAGHAVIAGACVTVLKAMLKTFDDDAATIETKWVDSGRTAVHAIDGTALLDYTAADAREMTVNGELNKLASNVALGRDFAGVHYRADGDGGLRVGEDYAISYLAEKIHTYREASKKYDLFQGWVLKKFDGSVVAITRKGVRPLGHRRHRRGVSGRRRRRKRRSHSDSD
ncbi:unnamed protein product [Symbiodinium sp. CCMP2456]|nr:unnamed protein product [Symbiodinium sp. CCMP2456]